MVELDQERFARLVAERRSLPWPFSPAQRPPQKPGPLKALLFQALKLGYTGWNAAVGAAGVSDEFGTEFFEAYRAAESYGALVVPGDVPVLSVFQGIGNALRAGASNPIGLQADGLRTMVRAVGGLGQRPRLAGVPGAVGITLGAALSSEGGGRTAPLLKVGALGMGLLLLLGLVAGDPTAETLKEAQVLESLDALDVPFALRAGLELASVLFGGVLLGAYATAVLRDRDEAMVGQLAGALSLAEQLRRDGSVPAEAETGGPLRCRWLKRTWPATLGEEAQRALRRAASTAVAEGERRPPARDSVEGVLSVPRRSRPAYGGEGGWLPLLELGQPLAEGEICELSLHEPRFLELMEVLAAAGGGGGAGLSLGALHVLVGSQRPLALDSGTAAGRGPTLSVEEEAVLGATATAVEVLESGEAQVPESSPPRRWRLRVRGTGRLLPLRERGLAADEAGVLWVAPPGKVASGSVLENEATSAAASGGSAVRCVAVVGLLHVNGIVSGMQRALRDPSA